MSAVGMFRRLRYPGLSWRARQVAASAVPVVEVPEAGNVLVPRVTVRFVENASGNDGVEAVAEVSDGKVTASRTAWSSLWSYPHGDREAGDWHVAAARRATEEAIQQARWMLAGAQAGHAVEAERAAEAGRAAAVTAGPVGSDATVRSGSGVAR